MIEFRVYEFFLMAPPSVIITDLLRLPVLLQDRIELFNGQRLDAPIQQKVLAVVAVGIGDHPKGPHRIYKVHSDCGLDWLVGKLKEITL